MSGPLRRVAVQLIPPVAWGAFVLVAWEWFVKWRRIKPFLLPAPSAIWAQMKTNHRGIIDTAKATGTNALVGLVVGVLLGVAVAFIAQRFRPIRGVISPVSAALNTPTYLRDTYLKDLAADPVKGEWASPEWKKANPGARNISSPTPDGAE